MLSPMAGRNSSFLIRHSAYREADGYDAKLLYPGDCDQIGDYIHTVDALFYGRDHPEAGSSVDPCKLLDVQDWFGLPANVFRPRSVMSQTRCRYQVLAALLAAHYVVTVIKRWSRGRRAYAPGLVAQSRHHGNFPFGSAYLPRHAIGIYHRIRGKKRFLTALPEPWMAIPSQARGRGRVRVSNA